MRLTFSFFVAAFVAGVSASNVIELNPDIWDDVVGQGKPGLVEFFAPWCGHCKNLAPTYEQLADAYAHAKDKVYIAKVDADGVGKDLAKKFGVTGYPTLKWFSGDGTMEPFESGRDLDSLAQTVTQKSNVKSNIKPPPPPEYLVLDYSTFDKVVMDPAKDVLVAFTAPWCGHCKAMKPAYEKVAIDFKPESNCIVANVDGDDKKNADLSRKFGVSSFPTIKFFSKDNKEGESYEGGRSEADFVSFLNERCGTSRAVGGGLTDTAGRLPDFDALASKFFVASADLRDSIYKEAVQLSATVGDASKLYIRVMEKMVNGTENYIEKEAKRLESILSKRSLAPTKLDEIKIKSNILRAFGEKPAEESTVRKATAEL